MRRFFVFFLCLGLVFGLFSACAGNSNDGVLETTEDTLQELVPLSDGKSLKVLAIGNSFSNNTTEYLYDIAAAEGMTEIVIGRLYFGGCSLQRHARNARMDVAEYTYYKNTSGYWDKTENATLLYGLQDEEWDIITMQQSSGNSGLPSTYGENLDELITYVNANKTNPEAKLVWHMTWAYQQDSDHQDFANYGNDQQNMYSGIVMTVQQEILTNSAFTSVIPAGTAIQNARTSYFSDNLTADGFHLNDLGKVIAGYMWYAAFAGKPLDAVNLKQVAGYFELSDSNKAVIMESVNNALKTPYAVTESSFVD